MCSTSNEPQKSRSEVVRHEILFNRSAMDVSEQTSAKILIALERLYDLLQEKTCVTELKKLRNS